MIKLEVANARQDVEREQGYFYLQHLISGIDGVQEATIKAINKGVLVVDAKKVDTIRERIAALSKGGLCVRVLDEMDTQ